MKEIIFKREVEEPIVFSDDLDNNSIVGIEYKFGRGIVVQTGWGEFKILELTSFPSMVDAFFCPTLKEYVEYSQKNDASFVKAFLFKTKKEALEWMADFYND